MLSIVSAVRGREEIARVGGRSLYTVQGHSKSLVLVPIESPYATAATSRGTARLL